MRASTREPDSEPVPSWLLSCGHEARLNETELEQLADLQSAAADLTSPLRPRLCRICQRVRTIRGLAGQ